MADNNIDIKELTELGLNEASGLISRREYNMSIVKSRQTAESLVKAYAVEKGVEYTTFADTIESLFKEGIINRTSRDALHNIRVYGNKAVREGDNDSEDAQKAFYLLKNEVGTFLSRKTVSVDRTPVRIDMPTSRSAARHVSREIRAGEAAARERVERDTEGREGRDQVLDVDVASLLRNPGTSSEAQRNLEEYDETERRTRMVSARSDRGSDRGTRSSRDSERSGRSERGERSGRRSGGQGRGAREEERSSGRSISIYDVLRILIPVIVVILLIIIVRSLIPTGGGKTKETTKAAVETVVEESTVQETEAPTTEAETEPAVVEYKIKGNGVNVRYADNQNRVYTQLSNGTAIGTVQEIEGSDFVAFTLDGVNVVVKKDFIEPIQ